MGSSLGLEIESRGGVAGRKRGVGFEGGKERMGDWIWQLNFGWRKEEKGKKRREEKKNKEEERVVGPICQFC